MLRPVKRTRLYEDVVAQIQRLIRTKKLSAGDRLPSERELAAMLGIGRPSVREALRTLDSMGLIEVRSGQGAFLRDISLNPYLATIRESLSFLLDVKEDALFELWEVRQGLEDQIAPLAAERRGEAHLAKLRRRTDEMRRCIGAPESFVRAGVAFHRTLAEAADNAVLLTVWEAISGLIESSQHRIVGTPGQPDEALAQHETLLAAVEAGDAERARAAMREHMENEGARLRAALGKVDRGHSKKKERGQAKSA
ncbi:MAG: FadR/GntR family transcriptional regulator [bacterium]